jgi:hypothetical protein
VAQDRGRKGRGSGRRPQGALEETLQVRVRRKNPLIERKVTDNEQFDTTLAVFDTPGETAPRPKSPSGRKSKAGARGSIRPERERAANERKRVQPLFDDDSSETTQEFGDIQEALRREAERQKELEETPRKRRTRPRSPTGKKRARPPSPRRSVSGPHFDEDATEIADHPPLSPLVEIPDPAEVKRASPESTNDARGRAGADETDGLQPIDPLPGDKTPATGSPPASLSATMPEPPRLESGESALLDRGPRGGASGARTIPARKLEPKPLAAEVAGAVPRHLLGKWGTDAVGAAAQRANIARLDESLPQARSAALKMLRSELSREEIASLETALAGSHDERGVEPSLSPKRSLEHLINETAYNELTIEERARLLKAIAVEPRDISTTKAAIAILKTSVIKRLRLDEREKLFALFVALTSETRALLARLAARPLRGRSAMEDRDFKDVGLVTNLAELAMGAAIPAEMENAGVKRARVLTLVLSSIAHPERLPFEEGSDGVLSMLEFALADGAPAELLRLWRELIGQHMCAELAGQNEIDLGDRVRGPGGVTFSSRDTPLRVALDQLAVLAHPRKSYEGTGFMMPGGHGVDADVISRALSFVYGMSFTVAAGAPTAMRHLLRIETEPYRVPPIFVTLLYERGERVFIFDHIDASKVYLRAPHGRSTKRAGAQRSDPTRIVEDADAGIDSVTREELEKLVGVALIPRR